MLTSLSHLHSPPSPAAPRRRQRRDGRGGMRIAENYHALVIFEAAHRAVVAWLRAPRFSGSPESVGIIKKKQKTPPKEIAKAEEARRRYLEQK